MQFYFLTLHFVGKGRYYTVVEGLFHCRQRWQTRSIPRSRHRQNPVNGSRLLWCQAADTARLLMLLWRSSELFFVLSDLWELLSGIHWDGQVGSCSSSSDDDEGMFGSELGVTGEVVVGLSFVPCTELTWLSLTDIHSRHLICDYCHTIHHWS